MAALGAEAPRPPALVALRALGLGDLLTAVPALRALRGAYPRHRLVLAAPRVLEPLARLTGAVDEVAHTRPLAPLPARCHRVDVLANLHGCGPESHRVALAATPRRTIAFANSAVPGTEGWPAWRPGEHEVMRWCRLLAESGIDTDPAALRIRPPARGAPPGLAGATVIHAGAGHRERMWPAERWAVVAQAERDAGRAVVLTGGTVERPLAEHVARRARLGPESLLVGSTDLADLASLVAAADRVLSSDTGIAHLATALGAPSVTLFGPSPPAEWGPLIDRGRHLVLWAGNGRRRARVCDIEVAEVLAALESLG